MTKMHLLANGKLSRFTQEEIDYFHHVFTVDPMGTNGVLFWRNVSEVPARERGKRAGGLRTQIYNWSRGKRFKRHKPYCYRAVSVRGKSLLEHGIVFAMTHGFCPALVDHQDADATNNRPGNLIDGSVLGATPVQGNTVRKYVKERVGFERGVSYHAETNKFRVKLSDPSLGRERSHPGNFRKHIKAFNTLDEANAYAREWIKANRIPAARPLQFNKDEVLNGMNRI